MGMTKAISYALALFIIAGPAVARTGTKHNSFHSFSTFDTATLAGLIYGQTVLSRALAAAKIQWDPTEAHSARYDTEKTAKLFCNQLSLSI